MVQQVADVAHGQAGARAHLLVGKVVVEFQAHEFAAAFVQRAEAQTHESDVFEARDVFVGRGLRIGGVVRGGGGFAGRGMERDDLAVAAVLVEREVVDGAEQPAARVTDGFPIRVTAHESFLNNVLGHSRFFEEAQGVREQRRFEGEESLFNRVKLGSIRPACLRPVHVDYVVGLAHGTIRLTCDIRRYDTGWHDFLDESFETMLWWQQKHEVEQKLAAGPHWSAAFTPLHHAQVEARLKADGMVLSPQEKLARDNLKTEDPQTQNLISILSGLDFNAATVSRISDSGK